MMSHNLPGVAVSNQTFVLYDPQILYLQNQGGISNYFIRIFSLIKDSSYNSIFPSPPFITIGLPFLLRLSLYYVHSFILFIRFFFNPPKIVHLTYYYPSFLSLLCSSTVSTFHDAIPETFCFRLSDIILVLLKKLQARFSKLIIFVSYTTASSLLLRSCYSYPLSAVIRHGANFSSYLSPCSLSFNSFDFDFPFLLYIGMRDYHKNFIDLLNLFDLFPDLSADYHLILVGGPTLSSFEKDRFRRFNIKFYHFYPDNYTLAFIYSKAHCLVFTSFSEGFGLPLVEAMTCRCPVICINQSAMAEVTMNHAVYYVQNDLVSLHSAVLSLRDPFYRYQIVSSAYEYSSKFTWEISASLHIQGYEKISN